MNKDVSTLEPKHSNSDLKEENIHMNKAIISKKNQKSQEVETELNKPIKLTRVETNFEKLPIWSVKPKKGTKFVPSKTIILEPEELEDGKLVERKIEIIPSAKYGYPTVQTEEYWYALQQLWHDSPTKETGRIEFSRKQIIEGVLGKTYGKHTRKALDLSLNQLGTTRFTFNYVFYDKAKDITHQEIKKFHLIVEENLTERKRKDEIIHDKCSVTLHPLVVSNLRSGYFKPIILSVVSQLKSDTARLLYRKLDTQFSYYSRYEISTERFFRENGLRGDTYKYPSVRKRLIEKGIKELINKRTSSGAIIKSYEIVRTKDQKDYKLIVRSGNIKTISKLSKKEQEKSTKIEDTIPIVEEITAATSTSNLDKAVQVLSNINLDKAAQTLLNQNSNKNISAPPAPDLEEKTSAPPAPDLEEKTSAPTAPKLRKKSELDPSKSLELFNYFCYVFLDGLDIDPSKKELTAINKIIKKYGLEKSKLFVNYAYQKSINSNFKPTSFTGITRSIGEAASQNALEEKRRSNANYLIHQADIEERKRKQRIIEYQSKNEKKYHKYILLVKEALAVRYSQELIRLKEWETEKRREIEQKIADTPENLLWLREKQLEMFDKKEGFEAARFIEYFEKYEDIKLPSFWEWDKEHNGDFMNTI